MPIEDVVQNKAQTPYGNYLNTFNKKKKKERGSLSLNKADTILWQIEDATVKFAQSVS